MSVRMKSVKIKDEMVQLIAKNVAINIIKNMTGLPLMFLKIKCHDELDKYWKSGYLTRRQAYKYLAEMMGYGTAHISNFNEDECLKLLKILRSK